MGADCGEGALTVREALQRGTERLAAAGVDEARFDAELLLCYALGASRAYLYAHPERCLRPEEEAAWHDALARRERREPLAYIVGKRGFYGLELAVDRRVLVPRPETEMIVERVLAFAARQPVRVVWDVGTGSGALALAIAQNLAGVTVVGADISREALEMAAENRRRLGLEGRVELVESDLLAAAHGPIDVVVANLPYLRSEEYLAAMPEVSRYEPRVALDGGPTGLALVERLLAQAAALTPQPGLLLMEIGAGQGADSVALAREHFPGRAAGLHRDLAGLDRMLEVTAELPAAREAGAGEPVTWVLPASDPAAVALAAGALRRGEVVAFPTDTVYGLGAAVFSQEGVRALYEVKGRPEAKAIPLLLADPVDVATVAAEVPPAAVRLMERFWPGGLTLVLPARPEVPAVVRAGGATVAVRVPGHPVARALIQAVGAPLATTSANRSGAPEALTAGEALRQLGSRLRWLLDGGPSPAGRASTVVDLSVEPPAVRRHGAIADDEIRALL
jgi:release factor glutamine methyltransferase